MVKYLKSIARPDHNKSRAIDEKSHRKVGQNSNKVSFLTLINIVLDAALCHWNSNFNENSKASFWPFLVVGLAKVLNAVDCSIKILYVGHYRVRVKSPTTLHISSQMGIISQPMNEVSSYYWNTTYFLCSIGTQVCACVCVWENTNVTLQYWHPHVKLWSDAIYLTTKNVCK